MLLRFFHFFTHSCIKKLAILTDSELNINKYYLNY